MTLLHDRTFLAEIKLDGANIIFFDTHPYGKRFDTQKSLITVPSGPDTSGGDLASYHASSGESPQYAYFIGHDDYTYTIQFRGGKHHGQYLGTDGKGAHALGAFPERGSNTTSFILYDSDLNVVTIEDINPMHDTLYMQLHQGAFIKKQLIDSKMYSYSGQWGTLIKLNLNIVKRGHESLDNYYKILSTGQFVRKPNATW
ncbi:hypothetical protein ACIQVE_05025 [Pseudomonas sp. NPDC098747]|uniref:hypothetical protein n=1 Tax=Pseudomonas sp. NPDC098747 TaxID=3364487 RepID=UPI00383B9538